MVADPVVLGPERAKRVDELAANDVGKECVPKGGDGEADVLNTPQARKCHACSPIALDLDGSNVASVHAPRLPRTAISCDWIQTRICSNWRDIVARPEGGRPCRSIGDWTRRPRGSS